MSDDKKTAPVEDSGKLKNARKPELLEAADYYGVEVEEGDTAKVLKEKFKEDGIDEEAYVQFLELKEKAAEAAELAAAEKAENEEKGVSSDEETLLIKMKRNNPSMTIRGHTFTHRHPYQLVPVKDAEFIVNKYKGFSVALPSEVEKYYA